jgi:cysteinyl-tRNA synthetase
MSKSAGSFLTLQSLAEKGYDPLDYRYFLLGGHYRTQLQFSYPSLEGARNARKSLVERVRLLGEKAGGFPEAPGEGALLEGVLNLEGKAGAHLEAFNRALEEDLSTPRALAELWSLLKDGEAEPAAALRAALDMDRVLGLRLAEPAREEEGALKEEIEGLVAERSAAKKAKDFARADAIRDSLRERGIILEDGPGGTSWRRSS